MTSNFIYDDVPYPSFVFPQTSPDRLSTLARIHGIEAAAPSDCRMLELGCGDGTNLLALAYAMPNSQFVGIDLAASHINAGKAAAAKLGLANIELLELDVTKADAGALGEFDFIVAHGLFSWVPDFVRPAILDLYTKCLAPNGIGYISYNALPGCLIREITHGMMKSGSRNVADPAEKVRAGIAFLSGIVEAAEADSVYQEMLGLELEQISERTPENVFHDDLSEVNRPFYFEEFGALLDTHGFQYLCEAEPSELARSAAFKFPASLGEDLVAREQYRDFVVGRRFRTTLFCRAGKEIDRSFPATRLLAIHLAGQFEIDDPAAVAGTGSLTVRAAKGNKFTLNHPPTKAAVVRIANSWPHGVLGSELIADMPENDGEATLGFLMQLFMAGFVKAHAFEQSFVTSISETPEVSRFARHQISEGSNAVATLTGLNLEIKDPAIGRLLSLCDGTRDIEDLTGAMFEYAAECGEAEVPGHDEMRESVLNNLQAFADAGLLVG
ncbi:MAG: type 12 methyltransferase [Acidobacteria bacterium OLB17]|nr:MAG: type 12 methyltransferase [Acidobacteria bacterium OLB17]MCZ2389595.1 class I SAM-dependent methyltransferase [Acidobacteriota bacterium]